jgi:hypothetical protein
MFQNPGRQLYSYTIKRRIRIVFSVVCILLCIVLITFGIDRLFTVKNIVVIGTGIHIDFDEKVLPHNLIFLSKDSLIRQIVSRYPQIDTVHLSKQWPSTLVIEIHMRTPVAYILTNGQYIAIDVHAYVLESTEKSTNLPILAFDIGVPSPGMKISDTRVLQSLVFLSHLDAGTYISKVSERDSATFQAQLFETNILIPQNSDIGKKADTLQTLISGFRMKGTLPGVIDLRFDKPIITK